MNNTNTFLIEDGAGPGEGIVIKRYDNYVNRFDKQIWAKMVRNEFKEKNQKAFGLKTTEGKKVVESEIAEEFVTEALVKKELSKIVHELADDDVYRDVHPRFESGNHALS
jgi:dephospho-CoA kinase